MWSLGNSHYSRVGMESLHATYDYLRLCDSWKLACFSAWLLKPPRPPSLMESTQSTSSTTSFTSSHSEYRSNFGHDRLNNQIKQWACFDLNRDLQLVNYLSNYAGVQGKSISLHDPIRNTSITFLKLIQFCESFNSQKTIPKKVT
jgi:hypothetical protein